MTKEIAPMVKGYSKQDFFFKLQDIDPRFDALKSINSHFRIYQIIDEKGAYTGCANFTDFVNTWNNKFKDVMFLDSFQSGRIVYVHWKEDVDQCKHVSKEELVEELISLEVEELPEPTPEPKPVKKPRAKRGSKKEA